MAGLRFAERVRHFVHRDSFVQFWFAPAWLGLGLASLVIATFAFKRIAPRLGRFSGTTMPEFTLSAEMATRAVQVRRTVQLAERYAPWRCDCYPQAIVARCLLGVLGIPFALCLGLRKDPVTGAMAAHAWVCSGPILVTGGEGEPEYRIVAVFEGGSRC